MKNPFEIGDPKTFQRIVTEADTAKFDSGVVHPVYATFALARDAEWAGRLFVLEMKEEDEEGIGTYLTIEHNATALLHDVVEITATLTTVQGNAVNCSFVATVGDTTIASGTTGQKILKKERTATLFSRGKE